MSARGLRPSRLAAAVAALALAAAACTGGSGDGDGGGGAGAGSADTRALPQAEPSPTEDGPSALDDPAAGGLPDPLVDPAEIVSGGPPPDGIPAIDEPRFQRAGAVGWLDDGEPVLSLTLRGETRAYPVQVLIWHEIVNDTVGDVPVAVTYCPLCSSALAFDRRVEDRTVTFGTSGSLYRSDLVMYDRQTESLWPQLEGRAVAGRLTGAALRTYPVSTVAWADWREANPDGWVLSRDTGHSRDYGTNPYGGYDAPRTDPFLLQGDPDRRLDPKARVVGLGRDTDPVAVALDGLLEERVREVEVDGRDVVVWAVPGLRSALDRQQVAEGREIGATGTFSPRLDGRRLTFGADGQEFVDAQTGSRWDVLGRAVAGPLEGDRLTPVRSVDTFWFAWAAFRPDTRIVR